LETDSPAISIFETEKAGSDPADAKSYMSKHAKLLEKILSGTADANIPFDGLCHLLQRLGFSMRVRGSHHIFYCEGVEEILNLQPRGASAKTYQVKQVRNMVLKYKLSEEKL